MLPDLPSFKEDLQSVFTRFVQFKAYKYMGAFSEAPQHTIHEGSLMRVYRADGTTEDSGMQQASAEMTLKSEEIPNMTVAKRVAMLDEMAKSMAAQMSTIFYNSLNDSLDKAGQVVDGKGKPFGVETIFEVLEKLHVDFDSNGNPKELTMSVPPALTPKIRQMIEDEKNDPSIHQRHEEIMDRKRTEWRDREATRKLVG